VSTSQYALNFGLLAYILWANLGSKPVTRRRLTLPLLLVAVAAGIYLRSIPTLGHDLDLEVAGAVAGALLGILAGVLVRVGRDDTGRVVMRAGAAYAALWIAVIGGRMVFAYGATNWFGPAIGRFSMSHQITGGPAWTAAFVLMALAMVLARVAVTGIAAARATRPAAVTA
jgi:uncharacterized protein (DUF697 family)